LRWQRREEEKRRRGEGEKGREEERGRRGEGAEQRKKNTHEPCPDSLMNKIFQKSQIFA
jgi:hypothetical protein